MAPPYHMAQIITGACYHFLASRNRMLETYGIEVNTREIRELHSNAVIDILFTGMLTSWPTGTAGGWRPRASAVNVTDVRSSMARRSAPFRCASFVLCLLVSMLDGFDTQSIAFVAAPSIEAVASDAVPVRGDLQRDAC